MMGGGIETPEATVDQQLPEDVRSLLTEVKAAAAGMLPIGIYEALYCAARDAGGGSFVEIGTAQGAATIAMALGGRAGGKPFHIYTADPFDRGSRLAVGSTAENLELVRSGFAAFGVTHDITIVAGECSDLLAAHDVQRVSLLLLDADGCIDRELELLFDRLQDEAVIVVDDVVDRIFAWREAAGLRIEQKHRLSFLLTHALCDRGYLRLDKMAAQTGFYRKGDSPFEPGAFAHVALEAYRALLDVRVDRAQIGLRAFSRRLLERRASRLLNVYRRLRYGRY